jgi:hypothetical protein
MTQTTKSSCRWRILSTRRRKGAENSRKRPRKKSSPPYASTHGSVSPLSLCAPPRLCVTIRGRILFPVRGIPGFSSWRRRSLGTEKGPHRCQAAFLLNAKSHRRKGHHAPRSCEVSRCTKRNERFGTVLRQKESERVCQRGRYGSGGKRSLEVPANEQPGNCQHVSENGVVGE